MDSMQSVSEEEIASGVTYLSIMEKNLETLRLALN
jgi:zinc transport system substrate-binding protein